MAPAPNEALNRDKIRVEISAFGPPAGWRAEARPARFFALGLRSTAKRATICRPVASRCQVFSQQNATSSRRNVTLSGTLRAFCDRKQALAPLHGQRPWLPGTHLIRGLWQKASCPLAVHWSPICSGRLVAGLVADLRWPVAWSPAGSPTCADLRRSAAAGGLTCIVWRILSCQVAADPGGRSAMWKSAKRKTGRLAVDPVSQAEADRRGTLGTVWREARGRFRRSGSSKRPVP